MKKCSYITNGVVLNENIVAESHSSGRASAMVGRLIPLKNPEPIISFFDQKKEYALHVLGDGCLRKSLEAKYSSNRLKFWGLKERAYVYKILESSQFFFSNSTVEGMPISVLEAISFGCIPILSEIPPHLELAEFGIKVFYINELNTIDDIFDALNELSDEEISNIVKRNHAILMENYSLDEMHNKYNAIYEEL
ncbi:glycosyltransferase [Vibrio sp. SCSIO 43135]|uniref:glycosyltransferase n=1 Tax=Vibrio sp. SCSIO 43135 TaxID=2819096 RepID=UPI002074D9C3|nr:glycosyltransferase [Vibrio sp. SCSIO 43135]USD41285.1 glycosyltransferase [Vibrio sp. SCSIO 43135]